MKSKGEKQNDWKTDVLTDQKKEKLTAKKHNQVT